MLCLNILLLLALSGFPVLAVELHVSPELSTSGTFNLSWEGKRDETFRLLQLSDSAQPRLIYQGTDTARIMTGLPDGEYIYRIEGETGRSEPLTVIVAHHSLVRALGFFGVGLLVFLATLILVLRGDRGE